LHLHKFMRHRAGQVRKGNPIIIRRPTIQSGVEFPGETFMAGPARKLDPAVPAQ
jgi:hypothetical protein